MGGLSQQLCSHIPTSEQWFLRAGVLCALLMMSTGCDPSANSPVNQNATPQMPSPSPAVPSQTAEEAPPEEIVQLEPVPVQPEPVYRPSDTRRVLTQEELDQYGLNTVESKHLRIYSDLPLEEITPLPGMIDQAYAAWVEYFGKLPENREGTDFQITGYLIEDVQLFRDAGLIPPVFSELGNGRHRGAEFWMPVPEPGYYRRHLLIHEATHCYMMYLPRISAPTWYLEGMAELFATHQQVGEKPIQFRVFPDQSSNFPKLGRIELINFDIEKSGLKSLVQLEQLEATGFQSTTSYAWAWAICAFLDNHPRYKKRFQQMGRDFLLEEPFDPLIRKTFGKELGQLNQQWIGYVSELQYGMDLSQLVINFQPGTPLAASEKVNCKIDSNLTWQSTQWTLEKGQTYQLQAEGQFTLAEDPKPWVSEANGISFQYYRGIPLGRLLGAIVPTANPDSDQLYTPHDQCFAIPAQFGNEVTFKAPYSGTLYLRLNDLPTQRHDNRGSVLVTLKKSEQ